MSQTLLKNVTLLDPRWDEARSARAAFSRNPNFSRRATRR